jgi:hypothetical protein
MAGSREEKAQLEKFLETARALGCDEDKEKFEAALGKIARHKPQLRRTKESKIKPSK